jgi:site-specific recombinase XerD
LGSRISYNVDASQNYGIIGNLIEMNTDTLKSLLPIFIEHLKQKSRSPSTILAYDSDLRQVLAYLERINKVTAVSVTRLDLENFRDYLLAQKYTAKTVSRKLNAIKTFFRFLKGEKIIEKDPSKEVSHPIIENTLPKSLSPLEYRALRDVVRSDIRVAAIVELILQTGTRISEIANLKLRNFKKDRIVVEAYATQPEREVPLNTPANEILEQYLKQRPGTESEYLFVSKTGKQLAVRNIRASIDRYMQKAEIPQYSVNDLRTTFIVENIKRGVDLATISQAVGHRRFSTTEHYLAVAGIKEAGKKAELEEL